MNDIIEKSTYHAVYDVSIIDALRYTRAHGFAGIQVAVETPHLSFEGLTEQQCREIAQFRADNDLMLSLHGPDDVASLFVSSPPLVRGLFDYFGALFDFAERISSHLVTVHLGQMVRFGTDTEPRRMLPQEDAPRHQSTLATNLQRLIGLAAERFVLCVENYKLDPLIFDVIQPLLASGEVFLCWDIAKTYLGQPEPDRNLEEFFWRNLAYVRQVHLHDIRDGISHRVIGTGHVDFMHFLPRLAEANVLEYCIEVRPREKAAESLANLQSLIGNDS